MRAESIRNSENPYASPHTDGLPILISCGEGQDAESVRLQYLRHEVTVKSIGTLFLVAAVYSIVAITIDEGRSRLDIALLAALAVVGLVLGLGLRRLDLRSRVPSAVLCGFGLLFVPVGTLANAYLIYLLLCDKGRVVFSAEYRAVIESTPQMRTRASRYSLAFVTIFALVTSTAFFTWGLARG